MNILFAISVVAFVALMWASISTAQHIRRARSRKSLARSVPNFEPTPFSPSPEAARAAQALASGEWGRTSRPDWKAAPRETASAPAPAARPEVITAPIIPSAPEPATKAPAPPAPPPPMPTASVPEIRFPLSSQRRASSAAIAIAAAESPAPEPAAAPEPPPAPRATDSSAAAVAASKFQLRRPPAAPTDSRTDWAYFNKDMGDLSDPEPRFRERPRSR